MTARTRPAAARTDLARIVKDFRSFCRQHADPAVVRKYARYFVEGYDAWGVPHAPYQEKLDDLRATLRARLDLTGIFDLGDLLFASGKYEEGSLAIALAADRRRTFRAGTLRRFRRWFDRGVRNWAHSDYLCGDALGEFFRQDIVPLESFGPWRTARSKWTRRAVPVAMLALVKLRRPARPLLDFIRPMMLDPERVVHQGLGWFLREAWKREPGPVESLLLEFRDSAPRLIFQYATEKMTPAQKNRFRRARA